MNEYDTKRIYDILKNIDYEKTDDLINANCYILNTCHIREKATEKVYHDVGRVKKRFRKLKKPIVIVTGCVAQAEGELLLKREKYIDAVVGPQSYHKIGEVILKIEEKEKKLNFTDFEVIKKFDALNFTKNTNSDVSTFLTIQEGCDKFCKFCVVPYTRGTEFSRSIDELINESSDLVNNGAREITLLGQNVNAYNYKGKKLSDLISEISKLNNLKRIRYTTSHPKDFSDDLIEMQTNSSKLMPLIHLPVQSGSDKILKNMNRKHSIKYYLDLIKKLKKVNPFIKFSSDFIIGYPGETQEDFLLSLNLMKEVKYINSYSFLFSPRPGTPAAEMKQVDNDVAKKRLLIFQKISDQIKIEYRKTLYNNNSLVLFENRIGTDNKFFGRDEFLNSVVVESDEDLSGKIKEVKILNGNKNTLFGEICDIVNKKEFAA